MASLYGCATFRFLRLRVRLSLGRGILIWVLHVAGYSCRRQAGHRLVCNFVCLVVFCCVRLNRVCNSLCNILQTDIDRFSSKWGTIQEPQFLKRVRNVKKSKKQSPIPRQTQCCRTQVNGSIMVYSILRHHTAQLSGLSGSTLDMADMLFILSPYLWNLENLFQMTNLVNITMKISYFLNWETFIQRQKYQRSVLRSVITACD